MKRIAVYPGSFDPVTIGHIDIIERVAKNFDEVVVLIAESDQKKSLFSISERKFFLNHVLQNLKNVRVDSYTGLTVDYLKLINAQVIIRGLRAVMDFEYEMTMASINQKLNSDIETMLIFARPEYYYISSRAVKEVARNGGALSGLVPESICQPLIEKLGRK